MSHCAFLLLDQSLSDLEIDFPPHVHLFAGGWALNSQNEWFESSPTWTGSPVSGTWDHDARLT